MLKHRSTNLPGGNPTCLGIIRYCIREASETTASEHKHVVVETDKHNYAHNSEASIERVVDIDFMEVTKCYDETVFRRLKPETL